MRDVAVLIPVYQDVKGLARTLRSLPNEMPLDVVVVDDGSSPPVPRLQIAQPHRLYILRLEKNLGIEHALNQGLNWIYNKGYPYTARLDAGDIALPGRFVRQSEFMAKHSECALVGGQVYFVDDNGDILYEECFPTEYKDIKRLIHCRSLFIHPAVMMRTEIIMELGGYGTKYKAAEDYELFLRICSKYEGYNLAEYVLIYHVSDKSISTTRRKQQCLSRLKAMVRYFNPKSKDSWIGLIKNVILVFSPIYVNRKLKQRLWRYRGWL